MIVTCGYIHIYIHTYDTQWEKKRGRWWVKKSEDRQRGMHDS